jgi:hypothetical protein
MGPRLLAAVAILTVLAVTVLVARSVIITPRSDFHHETDASSWPADRAWSWSFDLPRDLSERAGIALRIRTAASELGPDESPVLHSVTSPMAPAEAHRELGTGPYIWETRPSRSGSVTVQLLDLSEIGAESVRRGEDLRVLAKLTFEGYGTALAGDDRFLPAGRFVGYSVRSDGRWTNGELYLMSFYMQSDRTLSRYDVLLEQQGRPPE